MITFEKLLERAESEKIAIHTATEDQAVTLLKELDKRGYTWGSEAKLTTETRHGYYKENTCYEFDPNNEVCYSPLSFYQEYGYTIIEFSEIDFKENA